VDRISPLIRDARVWVRRAVAMGNNSCFEEPEVKSTEGLVRNFELLLERNTHCDADIIETARICLGLVRVRLGQDPGFGDMPFKHVLMSSCSIEEVLSFIEEKEQPLKSLLDLPLEDQLPDAALRDSQVMLSCTGEYDYCICMILVCLKLNSILSEDSIYPT